MPEIKKQVICMGGGGFTSGKNHILDLYALSQTNKTLPKVCFIPTASGDNFGLIKYFHQVYENLPCIPSHLSLFAPETSDLRSLILSQDLIYVGGGQTKSMLALWRDWGLDEIFKEAYEQGVILAGVSAGSVCWFEQCITDSYPEYLSVMPCLGLLPGSNCPHYGNGARQDAYQYFIEKDLIKNGYACNDNAALHFVNDQLWRSVSASSRAHTYQISRTAEGKFKQDQLPITFLARKETLQKIVFDSITFKQY